MSKTVELDRSHFKKISDVAMRNLNTAKDMVLQKDWSNPQAKVLLIHPKIHLVGHCMVLFRNWLNERNLFGGRVKLTEAQRNKLKGRDGCHKIAFIVVVSSISTKHAFQVAREEANKLWPTPPAAETITGQKRGSI
jgi:hypothetical protein